MGGGYGYAQVRTAGFGQSSMGRFEVMIVERFLVATHQHSMVAVDESLRPTCLFQQDLGGFDC